MKVNHIIIRKSGILKNIDTPCSQVNLVMGDNERGKTTLLNWIARGVFEKPSNNGDTWTTSIDNFSNIQFDLQVFHQYDSKRMKNLLTFKETDLLFKHKNKEELNKQEYWNAELNSLLYGNDNLSMSLEKRFSHAMGVDTKNKKNSWLVQLHNGLFELKNTLEDLLPEFENIQSKSHGISQLNHSLGQISQYEKEFEHKEQLYFTIDKIQIAKKYIKFAEQKEGIDNMLHETSHLLNKQDELKLELMKKEDMLLDYDDSISELKLDIHKKENKAQQVSSEPFEVYHSGLGATIFQVFLGVTLIILGLFFAFRSMNNIEISFIKGLALLCFVSGSILLMKTGIKSLALQYLTQSSEQNPNAIHKILMHKSKKDIHSVEKKLEDNQKKLLTVKEEISQIRQELKNIQLKLETGIKYQREGNLFQQEFATQHELVMKLFHTDDPTIIYQKIEKMQQQIDMHNPYFNYDDLYNLRQEKDELLQQKTKISDDYSSIKMKITKKIKALIEEIQGIHNREVIQHFYPEVFQFNPKIVDLVQYNNTLEITEFLINKVSNDRYRAEKLVSLFNQIESNNETLLTKILNTNFFTYLTQNIFGGKYHHFSTKHIPNEGVKIFAETGNGESYPLESLSAGTYSQFWFILKMALAKSIIKNEPGILILDDPFNSFDSIRKLYFLDAINALVHQGWQIFISITNDSQIEEYCTSMFQPILTVIDLNKTSG